MVGEQRINKGEKDKGERENGRHIARAHEEGLVSSNKVVPNNGDSSSSWSSVMLRVESPK
jgi:hypothetical protein